MRRASCVRATGYLKPWLALLPLVPMVVGCIVERTSVPIGGLLWYSPPLRARAVYSTLPRSPVREGLRYLLPASQGVRDAPASPKAAVLRLRSLLKKGLHGSRFLQWGEGGSHEAAATLSAGRPGLRLARGGPPVSRRGKEGEEQGERESLQTPTSSVSMAAYDDQGGDEYYVDDPVGSFEQDLVYALDASVRHTVNQALAQAIRPIKHHLIGFAEQQGSVAPSVSQMVEDPSLSGGSQALKPVTVSNLWRRGWRGAMMSRGQEEHQCLAMHFEPLPERTRRGSY
ncbi:hypothetical protein NDU88_000459 [Pleurodeles waltl]|uniref:Uncharacterized protein n=1 Tax=Pleurodeles waltl TaxID=8319 RepID=A0AAV7UQK0_PLEWA|nr:hypothetical protein NDU88_000459 [Pleurodeles waltl]